MSQRAVRPTVAPPNGRAEATADVGGPTSPSPDVSGQVKMICPPAAIS
jgi:hypothetical protein